MAHELVGFLLGEGYSTEAVGDMLTPMEMYDEGESAIPTRGTSSLQSRTPYEIYDTDETVKKITQVMREDRQPPGPQVASATPAKNPAAKAIRVDTEPSFKAFRAGAANKPPADDVEAVEAVAMRELLGEGPGEGLGDHGMYGDFYRIPVTDSRIGDDFYRVPVTSSRILGEDQPCVVCGKTCGQAVCGVCLGFGERGSAADIYGAFGDRGAASTSNLMGDVQALSVPSLMHEGATIPLNFRNQTAQPDADQHVGAWQSGDNIYTSVRLTGWDRQPRVLTMTTPYSKEMGIIVGYAERLGIAPASYLPVIDTLAKRNGASKLVPITCAGAASVLRAVRGRRGPLVLGLVPGRR